MISVLEYYQLGRAQLAGLTGDALLNAQKSLMSLAPTATPEETSNIQAALNDQLPYFTRDPDGTPHLVIPPPPQPAPAPVTPPGTTSPAPAGPTVSPTTANTAPATAPPTETLAPTPTPTTTTTGQCPPGEVPLNSFVGSSTQTPQELQGQIQSALTSIAPTSTPSGCPCDVSLSPLQLVNANDFLRVSLWNTASCPTTVTVTVRWVDCNCNIHTSSGQVSMAAYVRSGAGAFGPPLTATICLPLSDGYLLSVVVTMTATFVAEAHMWTVAELRSGGCSGPPSATLIQNYLQFGKDLSWPEGSQISVGEGPGTFRWRNFSYNGGDGGTDTMNVQGGSIAIVRQVYFVLNTSAAAGNRQVWLEYTAPEMPGPMAFTNGQAQPPNTSWGWIFAPNLAPGLFNTFWSQVPIPDNLWTSGAGGVNLIISGDDVGDSMSTGGVAFGMWAGPPVAF